MSRPSQIRFLSRWAGAYDPVVRLMGFPRLWQVMAAIAAPLPQEYALDVCTGTGGVAIELANRGAHVVGVDLAPGMLMQAHTKYHGRAERPPARHGVTSSSATFIQMDARQLAFPGETFPLITCTMALHEMSEEERTRVLSEIVRVGRGRVIIADYHVPRTFPASWLFRIRYGFEYLESDDFKHFVSRDVRERLEQAGLHVSPPHDVGRFRIWPCRIQRTVP